MAGGGRASPPCAGNFSGEGHSRMAGGGRSRPPYAGNFSREEHNGIAGGGRASLRAAKGQKKVSEPHHMLPAAFPTRDRHVLLQVKSKASPPRGIDLTI